MGRRCQRGPVVRQHIQVLVCVGSNLQLPPESPMRRAAPLSMPAVLLVMKIRVAQPTFGANMRHRCRRAASAATAIAGSLPVLMAPMRQGTVVAHSAARLV